MGEPRDLIPPTPVVREQLARNILEGRRLRSLLRISIQAERDQENLKRGRDRLREAIPA